MKPKLTLLLATGAQGAALAIPAWSAIGVAMDTFPRAASAEGGTYRMASDDEGAYRRGYGEGDDDEGEYRDGRGEHEDDDDEAGPRAAQAGSVAPPQNGLLNKGTTPQVKVK